MAQKVIVRLVDDIDGSEANNTIPFSIDGNAYEIDLNDQHANELRGAFERFATAGRRIGKASSRAGRSSGGSTASGGGVRREDSAEVRKWAIERGLMQDTSRGRISRAVYEAYDRDH